MNEEEKFEREFVKVAVDIAVNQLGMEKKQFAIEALMVDDRNEGSAERALYSLLKPTLKTGKPQTLSLREAYRMAKTIKEDFARLCWKVEDAIKKDSQES